MNAILTAACIGMVVGFFLMFGISPMEFTEGIFNRLLAKPNSIKSQINEATKRKKPNIFRREISEAQEILRLTNRTNMCGTRFGAMLQNDTAAKFAFCCGR